MNAFDQNSSAVSNAVARGAGLCAAVVGGGVLLGWALDLALLKSVLPGLATMKPNTALCLLLAGVGLAVRSDRLRLLRLGCAAVVTVVAVLTLGEYATGSDVGIDQLVFHDPDSNGRMSPITAVLFGGVGTALALLPTGRGPLLGQGLAVLVLLGAAVPLCGYLYGVDELYAVYPFSSIALHTAVTFVVLALGLLAAGPPLGFMALLVAPGVEGTLVRRLLPAAALVVVLLGWGVVLGYRAGAYYTEFAMALFTLLVAFVLSCLIFWTGFAVAHSERARHRNQEALQRSQQELAHLFESMPQLVWACDPDLSNQHFNTRYLEYTGLHLPVSAPLAWVETIHPDDRARTGAAWQQAVTTGGLFEVENRVRRAADGIYRWHLVRGVPIKNAAGTAVRYIGTCTEIDDHKEAERRLRELSESLERRVAERTAAAEERARQLAASEASLKHQTHLLETIVDNMGEGLIVGDENGHMLLFNAAARRLHGDPIDTTGAQWSQNYDLYLPDQSAHFPLEQLPIVRAFAGEACDNVELLVRNERHPQGVYISASGRPLPVDEGQPRMGVVVIRDVTARLKADAALRESEESFRNAFEYAPSGMFLRSLDGYWRDVNPALLHMLGLAKADLLGRHYRAIMHPEEVPVTETQLRQLIAADIPSFQAEQRFRHRQGHYVWTLVSAAVVRNVQRQPLSVIGHVHDITQRKQSEAALRASLEEKQTLLREIHHRVKNNLQVISSLLDLQAQHLRDGAMLAAFRESQTRVHSMALVHESLYQNEALASLDFAAYLRRLVGHLAQTYGEVAAAVDCRLHLDAVELPLDAAIPSGLIVNELLTNCYKYAFPHERRGRIDLSVRQHGDEIVLAVQDDGVGIAPEVDLKKVKSLGLRLVQALTQQLQGQLRLERTGGTLIEVRFPGAVKNERGRVSAP